MEKINSEWVCCPVCGNKTRDKIRKDINATINMYKNDHIKMYKINST